MLRVLSAVLCGALVVFVSTARTRADTESEEPQSAENGGQAVENTNTAGADTAGADTAGADTAGADTAGADTAGADTAGADTAGADTAGADTGGNGGETADTLRAAGDPVGVDAIYAIVDTRVITYGEIIRKAEPIAQRRWEADPKSDKEQVRKQTFSEVATEIITRVLILKAARQEGYTVGEAQVGSEINRALHREGLTLEQYLDKYNMTYGELYREVRDDLLYRRFLHVQIAPRVFVSPSEVAAYYEAHKDDAAFLSPEQVWAHEIVIMAGDPRQRGEKAEEAYKELQDGADFATVAKKYSESPRTAPNGGDLGWITRKVMPPEVNQALFEDIDIGEVSNVIQDQYGYLWIVMVTARREASRTPLDEAYASIEAGLRWIKLQEETRKYALRLQKTTAIIDPNAMLR